MEAPREAPTPLSVKKEKKKKKHTCDRFKSRFSEAVGVISGDFGKPPNGELSLKRSEATSLTEWEECVIVASSALPQLLRCALSNWFMPVLLPRVVIWEPSGVVYRAHKKSKPGVLATQTVSPMLLKWFSGDDRNGSICTG